MRRIRLSALALFGHPLARDETPLMRRAVHHTGRRDPCATTEVVVAITLSVIKMHSSAHPLLIGHIHQKELAQHIKNGAV